MEEGDSDPKVIGWNCERKPRSISTVKNHFLVKCTVCPPPDKFVHLVSKHTFDKHQKGINSSTQLVAMLF